jgi:inorganic pyrophosphatase
MLLRCILDMSSNITRYTARIEVSRGGFVKFRDEDAIDFISPIPCPYNYGSVEGFIGGDGDPLDAVILGPRLARGELVEAQLVSVVYFRDAGAIDDKLILSPTGEGPSRIQQVQLRVFFQTYALVKRAMHILRRRPGPTAFEGFGSKPRRELSP